MIVQLFDRAFKLMKKAPIDGDFVEFGVYRGDSLCQTIKMANKFLEKNYKFYGFDTFEGMPVTKQPLTNELAHNWAPNTFSETSYQFVSNKLKQEKLKARLVKGPFSKVKPLSKLGISKIKFAHIDADIYEGYHDALKKITPHVQVGTIIIFDESRAPSDYRYQDVKYHGTKAVQEWVDKTGLNLHLIRFKWTCELMVIVDNDYLKEYGNYIEILRNDNYVQSFMDIVNQKLR